jgi:hypothetical protein
LCFRPFAEKLFDKFHTFGDAIGHLTLTLNGAATIVSETR